MAFTASPPATKLKPAASPFPRQIGRHPQFRIPYFNRLITELNRSSRVMLDYPAAAAARNLGGTEHGEENMRRIVMSDVVVKGDQRKVFGGRKWNSMDISTAAVVLAMHLLALPAPLCFSWTAFWVAVWLYVVTGLFGITLSFHRHLSHRSFRLPKWLEYLFAYCGVHALQGVRVIWVYHITWLVNSACHVWGTQDWNTGDLSRNNWWVAVLAFGEGWHNNHHAFEYSARHGFKWWQIDMTWYTIRILQALRLAADVKLPSQSQKKKMMGLN